jgi:hypothetical protein
LLEKPQVNQRTEYLDPTGSGSRIIAAYALFVLLLLAIS